MRSRSTARGPRLDGLPQPEDATTLLKTLSHYASQRMLNAGVKVSARDGRSAHSLRHTCASDALDAGLNIRVVQGLLGHATISTTQVYLRPAALEDPQRAVDRDYRREHDAAEGAA